MKEEPAARRGCGFTGRWVENSRKARISRSRCRSRSRSAGGMGGMGGMGDVSDMDKAGDLDCMSLAMRVVWVTWVI